MNSWEYDERHGPSDRRQPSAAVERVIMDAMAEANRYCREIHIFDRARMREIAERAQARIKELQEMEAAK